MCEELDKLILHRRTISSKILEKCWTQKTVKILERENKMGIQYIQRNYKKFLQYINKDQYYEQGNIIIDYYISAQKIELTEITTNLLN